MREKALPIINIVLSSIAIILTIGFNIYFSKYEYKSPGTMIWILLESGILLINVLILFFDFSYAHGISIFGALAAIIVGGMYIILELLGKKGEYDNIYLFFIPHLIIYSVILAIEIIYYTRYVKNKS